MPARREVESRSHPPHVTRDDIVAGLRAVGLGPRDIVLVHSSLSSFGHVVGGADTVIDALLETVGAEGTVVMPTFTWEAFHDKRGVVFDIARTPVKSEVGIIPETFRRRDAAVRSRHICHSVAAIGPHALDVMGAGVSSFGSGSTFDQLYLLDAWVLLLGVGFAACTALHAAEELLQVPYRAYRDFRDSTIILPDGTEEPSQSVEFLRREGYQNDFGKMHTVFAQEGVLLTGSIGTATVINARLRDIVDVTKGYLERDSGFLLTEASRERLYEELGDAPLRGSTQQGAHPMSSDAIALSDVQHVVVAHDPTHWCAVPANNGGNAPIWQWGDELLLGYTQGVHETTARGHQTNDGHGYASWLARSLDGGITWRSWTPRPYAGQGGIAAPPPAALDLASPGLALRIEGNGYHGNAGARWFHSADRGATWRGPYSFDGLLDHPALAGMEFTARTAYLADGPDALLLFLSARRPSAAAPTAVSLTDRTFVARLTANPVTFAFVSWVTPDSDAYRAVMPAPVRLSPDRLVVALRRKSLAHNWIDVYASSDNGTTWTWLSKVGDTEDGNDYNGNPPALARLADGRLCCVYGHRSRRQMLVRFSADAGATWRAPLLLRDDFRSLNGWPDLGYPRLFCRTDGRLVAAYFWCTLAQPQTHIEATIFTPPD